MRHCALKDVVKVAINGCSQCMAKIMCVCVLIQFSLQISGTKPCTFILSRSASLCTMDGGKLVYCGEGNDLLQAALREVGGQEEGKLLLVPR